MEKLTITKVYRTDKNKKGEPYLTQDGRSYTRLSIQTKEHGQKWLSGFGNDKNSGWKMGDIVEVIVEQKGDFLNFSMPKIVDALEERVAKLEADVKALLSYMLADKPGEEPPEEFVEEAPF